MESDFYSILYDMFYDPVNALNHSSYEEDDSKDSLIMMKKPFCLQLHIFSM